MKLTFIGTRGYIERRSPQHRMHTSLLVSYRGKRVMVDCGEDWLGNVGKVRPGAIVITHAHPDHAWGLKKGAMCPVYATADSWEGMDGFAVEKRHLVTPRISTDILGITFEAFPVEHSIRAPAVGYRITAGRVAIFYVPDVIYIHDRAEALSGISLYIGDGASLSTPMVRRRGSSLIGHAPVSTQLTWCAKEGVPHAVITHCGPEIVSQEYRAAVAKINEMAAKRGVSAGLAHDGMEIILRGGRLSQPSGRH